MYFHANGIRLRYIQEGAGEPILLLHGRGGSISTWIATGVVENLAKDYRVIALDLRGHGKSGKPHDPKQYGAAMALDVVGLLDHLGIDRAHIVGYSLGANILAQLLTIRPDRFLTATLVASAGRVSWTPEDEMSFEQQASETEKTEAKPDFDPRAIAAMLRSFRQQVITPQQVAAVRVPTLGIVGSADPFLPSMEVVRGLRPGMKLVIVEGAEHGGARGVLRRPEFIAAFREFVVAHRPPTQSRSESPEGRAWSQGTADGVDVRPNNAFERTVEHRGPRLAAARASWPAAQLGR
jgi:pimeloyl-ACP methyl ester carboxylesterase